MGKPTAAQREKRRQEKLLKQKRKKAVKKANSSATRPSGNQSNPDELPSLSEIRNHLSSLVTVESSAGHEHGDFDCPVCSAPYNPNAVPNPDSWTQIDESERHQLVLDWHRHGNITEPNMAAHVAIHVAVENQVIDDSIPQVRETIARLMSEGLDRHDAVHAVGSVLAETMFNVMSTKSAGPEVNKKYLDRVLQLTAQSWLAVHGNRNE